MKTIFLPNFNLFGFLFSLDRAGYLLYNLGRKFIENLFRGSAAVAQLTVGTFSPFN